MLKTIPCVFAVQNEYQIIFAVENEEFAYIEIGDESFFDDANGVMKSVDPIRKISVPMSVLDAAGGYTVVEEIADERRAYSIKLGKVSKTSFRFYPVPEKNAKALFFADTHGDSVYPCSIADNNDFDFLIFGGDLYGDLETEDSFLTPLIIGGESAKGEKPIIFARGNHDLRGHLAEFLPKYTPTCDGKSYYSVRVGSTWFLVLDASEDKNDSNIEYSHSIRCHNFRLKETEFIKDIIKRKDKEYSAPGIAKRVVICHIPFTEQTEELFNIEEDIYRLWAKLLNDEVKPDIMFSAHTHNVVKYETGGKYDFLGQPCVIWTGSHWGDYEDGPYFQGLKISFGDETAVDICEAKKAKD